MTVKHLLAGLPSSDCWMPSTINTWYLTTTMTGKPQIKPFRWHHLRISQGCCGLQVHTQQVCLCVQMHSRLHYFFFFLKPPPRFSALKPSLFPFLPSPGKNPQFVYWREGMTTSSRYNSTPFEIPCFLFFACLSISVHLLLSLLNKVLVGSLLLRFTSLPPLPLSRAAVSHHFEGNLFINVISGDPQASISMLTQNMPV